MANKETGFEQTERARLASQFVNSTNSHIFLTGKAGTGKTTFLRELSRTTHKHHVIVAPTGIAALNANGVTIHSQFLFPFGTFIPGNDGPQNVAENTPYFNERILATRHPLNAKRREVLRNIDLLIIDEVSMLRADLLDAIDYRLRSLKRNHSERFGGVQLLMIGDLHQLPPVVKDHELGWMQAHYSSPHFFESIALKQSGFVYVELDKIFRQQNSEFIGILNNLRDNKATATDIERLNEHYSEEPNSEDGIITLTTHNYQADKINREKLDDLPTKSEYFEAEVEGDFPDRLFPVDESLELKVGAQVMFVKNDSQEGKYFNGKLAKVVEIEAGDITVDFTDGSGEYVLRREEWENKRYIVDDSTKELNEDVIGSFMQFPVKLAWAITVHKSQGLTFEKAIIDVGKAFAPGQVYVALSRLTSLDGLTLRTKIQPNIISSDLQVISFTEENDLQDGLPTVLREKQASFLKSTLHAYFGFEDILSQFEHILRKHDPHQFEDAEMRSALDLLRDSFRKEEGNMTKFRMQIDHFLYHGETEKLLERVPKASGYYQTFLLKSLKALLIHITEVELLTKTKTYRTALAELDLLFMRKLEQVEKSEHLVKCIVNQKEITALPDIDRERLSARERIIKSVEDHIAKNPKTSNLKTGRKRKKKGPRVETGSTYEETFKLLNEGLDIDQIAEQRGLKSSTLEGHFSKGLKEGKITLDQVMGEEDIKVLTEFFDENKGMQITTAFGKLKGEYSYGKLRMIQASLMSASNEGDTTP